MLFFIINLTIGKYYPKFITQFIIGCVLYAFVFLILNDFVSDDIYEKYKYYVLSLVIVDVSFLIYKTKFMNEEKMDTTSEEQLTISQNQQIESTSYNTDEKNTLSNTDSQSEKSINLLSESNSINGLIISESDENSIFSPSSVTSPEMTSE